MITAFCALLGGALYLYAGFLFIRQCLRNKQTVLGGCTAKDDAPMVIVSWLVWPLIIVCYGITWASRHLFRILFQPGGPQ